MGHQRKARLPQLDVLGHERSSRFELVHQRNQDEEHLGWEVLQVGRSDANGEAR